jgi:hypothetical protein
MKDKIRRASGNLVIVKAEDVPAATDKRLQEESHINNFFLFSMRIEYLTRCDEVV